MIDAPNPFESRLAGLQPRALSPDLEARIAGALSEARNNRWGDRLLWSAIASGAAAACVIAALLAAEPGTSSSAHMPNLPVAESRPPSVPFPLLARAGQRWGDELDPDHHWSLR